MKKDTEITGVDAFIPEVWSKEIYYQTMLTSKFAHIFRRSYEGEIENQNDTVKTPHRTDIGSSTVIISKHKYFAFRVDDMAKVQSNPDLISGYAAQGARGLANVIDKDISTLVTEPAITQNVGVANSAGVYQDITDTMIGNAIQGLDEHNAPFENRYIAVSPTQKKILVKMDNFIEYPTNKTIKGVFGEIRGLKAIVLNRLVDVRDEEGDYKSCMIFHQDALVFCIKPEIRVQAAYDLDYLATSVVGDALYGVGIQAPKLMVQVRTVSEI